MTRPLEVILLGKTEAGVDGLISALEQAGFAPRVEIVESAGTLRAELRVGGWDVVIATPIAQPPCLEALRVVREHDAEIPFLVLAGQVGEEQVADWIHGGVQGFIREDNLDRIGPVLERELAVAAQKRSGRAERDAQDSLASIVLASSREGIVITDAELRVRSVNDAFLVVFRTVRDEVMGRDFQRYSKKHCDTGLDAQAFDLARRDGRWQGEVGGRLPSSERFSHWWSISAVRGADGRASHFIVVVNDQTEVRSAEARVHYLAHYDVLTDLPNRNLLQERMFVSLTAAERNSESLCLLFVDVDRFKHVNDTFGHLLGDGLLRAVAGRLRACARECDTVARVGGDEFVLLLPRAGPAIARTVALRLIAALAEPFDVDNRRISTSGSVGISVYPQDGHTPDELLSAADAALYQAKTDGRNRLQFYTEAIDQALHESVAIEHGLRDALRNNAFELYFQPQVARENYRVLGAEALLRWRRPDGQLVSPAAFIRVAEETGLILPIGTWVLNEACRQAGEWRRAGLPPVRVSVNLSALQFRQRDLVAEVVKALEEAQLPATQLELELTETLLFEEVRSDLAAIAELSSRGVRWAIDDFGTGYSNLSYLRRFPVSTLKIDRSFIQDVGENEDDAAITRGIIGLAHSLRLEVIAEGVENAAQHHFLSLERCDAFQGYFFGRPVPAPEFIEVLRVTASRYAPIAIGATARPGS